MLFVLQLSFVDLAGLERVKKSGKCDMQDDDELYDEFGNLKKKFRAKSHQAEAGKGIVGGGRAGWEVEELGTYAC